MKDMMGLMKQAQAMQAKMQDMQAEMERLEVDGQSGGGLVRVTLTAKGAMKGLAIDASLMKAEARPYAHLPGGHQEGWADAFRNILADAYQWIREGAHASAKPATVCDFANGYRICRIVEAMLQSHAAGGIWTKVKPAS